MSDRDGVFDDYMGVQYREGKQAYKLGIVQNPYSYGMEMAKAWQEGFDEEASKDNITHPSKAAYKEI